MVSASHESVRAGKYRFAVVIPVYGEGEYIAKTLISLSANDNCYLEKALVLLVINNPAVGADSGYVKENQRFLKELNEGSLQKKHDLDNLNLVWIDASSNGLELPEKGGVGMRRKLGMDAVLKYIGWDCDPIIISLDADTIVENNYFEAIEDFFNIHKDISAGFVSFKHLSGKTPEEEKAVREYEYSIRHYIDGLKRAGSPYAYHTIGSTILCRADAYVRAGGMKQHRGGEDFYFMQALRKLGPPIMEITDTTVFQSARPSDRVPFGTGPKVRECLDGKELKLYNPKVFNVLKEFLLKVEEWIKSGELNKPEQFVDSLPDEVKGYFISLKFNEIWPNSPE